MMRICCCGNRDRGDDAAGVLVAERLEQLGVDAEVIAGDPLAMIETWKPTDEVIIVDAMVTGAPVGTVQIWDAPLRASPLGGRSSTHGLGVGETIQLAETLGRLPRRLRVYGIEGKQFQPEAGVSRQVLSAVETVARQIAAELAPVR
jgi:hydrogenase maturation protease